MWHATYSQGLGAPVWPDIVLVLSGTDFVVEPDLEELSKKGGMEVLMKSKGTVAKVLS